MQCKSLRESGKEIEKFDVAFFGASVDPIEKNKQFAKKLDLNFPLLSDTDKSAAKAYGILRGKWANRVTFYVDKEGKIAYIEQKVDVRSAGKQLLKKLDELGFQRKAK